MRYLFYQGAISPVGVKNAQALLASAHNEGLKEITLCLCSEGGDVTSGIGLYNFLEMLPAHVTTYAAGVCDSIAATVLLAGTRRVIAPSGHLILHASTYTSGPNQRQKFFNIPACQPFVDKLGWTEQEARSRFSDTDFHVDAQTACNLRIANEIRFIKLDPADEMRTILVP